MKKYLEIFAECKLQFAICTVLCTLTLCRNQQKAAPAETAKACSLPVNGRKSGEELLSQPSPVNG